VISIDYSQPSVKGRTIGKDLEPKMALYGAPALMKPLFLKPSKDVKVNGKALPAGKYGLFSLSGNR
jgi:hypothetical protein